MRQLFVSYAHKDRCWFDEIIPRLDALAGKAGWRLWTDLLLPDDLDPEDGDAARDIIVPEVLQSDAFLVLLSENMSMSRFIREIEADRMAAMDMQWGKEIYLINLDGVELQDHLLSRYEIQRTQNYSALSPEGRADVLAGLADHLAELPK
ncbi:MAG: TIR domain-containing protein [Pseudomonadota bacterium]